MFTLQHTHTHTEKKQSK